MSAAPVACPRCNWRTNRAYRHCECDCEGGVCACGPAVRYGRCTRCPGVRMETPADLRARRENDATVALMTAQGAT